MFEKNRDKSEQAAQEDHTQFKGILASSSFSQQHEVIRQQLNTTVQRNYGISRFASVLIIYNPISSKGSTKEKAESTAAALQKLGIVTTVVESLAKSNHYKKSGLSQQIKEQDLVLIIGGDGTLRKLLGLLSASSTPVYMIPAGNESLFAKSYGMRSDLQTLLHCLNERPFVEQHFGIISGDTIKGSKPFFSMASMGLDSLTVKAIGKRTGPINDRFYTSKGLQAFLKLHHPIISISIDGKTLVQQERGYLIIANSPEYARNLRIVPEAHASEPFLNVAFRKGNNHLVELYKIMRMAFQQPARLDMLRQRGRSITVTLHGPDYPLQVDGDYFRNRDVRSGVTFTFSISKTPLQVLAPSEPPQPIS